MVVFRAYLKDTGHPVKIDSDGQAEIILSVPANELTNALPIVAMGKKILVCGISEEDSKEDQDEFAKWLKN